MLARSSDDIDRDFGLSCGVGGPAAEMWLGLDRGDVLDGSGVVNKVRAEPGADLDHFATETGQQ